MSAELEDIGLIWAILDRRMERGFSTQDRQALPRLHSTRFVGRLYDFLTI